VSQAIIDRAEIARLEAELQAAFEKAVAEHKKHLPAIQPGTPGPDPWDTTTWDDRVQSTIMPVAERLLKELASKAMAAVPAALAGFGAVMTAQGIQEIIAAGLDSIATTATEVGGQIGQAMVTAITTSASASDLATSLDGVFAGADGRGLMVSRLMDHVSNAVSQAVVLGDSSYSQGQYVGGSKTWQTMEDDKVRPEHAAIDPTTVPVDGYFNVGGESAAYPGDPNLSDAMAANCRCVLVYDTGWGGGATAPPSVMP
jgi:hypothetical protein